MEKNDMLKKVQILGFVVSDIAMFLDTHPTDTVALNFYDKYKALLMQAEKQYTSTYGPLTIDNVNTDYGWTWIDNPWPWETEA